ncbi:MAG: biopolymer transporter ExbD [Prevotella sp.]|nr:biopolymer transporter ExbD [Candidatus Equicola faecalis]
MSVFRRRTHQHSVPGLNTASLPDLIFSVLFFFMIVTNMRTQDVRVKITEPTGRELTKMQRKNLATYIFIGTPIHGDGWQVQVDGTFMRPDETVVYMQQKIKDMGEEDATKMIVNIKADRNVPMSVVKDVKKNLRKVGTFQVHYSANEQHKKKR